MNENMSFMEFLVWNLGGIIVTFIVIGFMKMIGG